MIPNITHSTSSGNYLGYNLGDKKEQYQKVQFQEAVGVMIDDRLVDRLNQNWVDGDEKSYKAFRKVSMAIANDLDDQFRAQASLNGRVKIRAINVSLSYSPEDTDKVNEVVYDEAHDDYVPLRLKMGREFLGGMGFGDIQYVAVSHQGTHCAHDHYAINTVRADGSTIKLNFDFVRAQKIAEEIRQKYGLTPPDESLQMIAPKAKDALKQSCSWEEYEQRLQEHGISLSFSDHSKSGRGYGVSYSAGKKVIPGSKLHRSLSYGQVDAALKKNLAARQAQEEASARQRAEGEARLAAERAARDAAREEFQVLRAAYSEMVPTIQKLHATVNSAYQLYTDAKKAGVAIDGDTNQRYSELKQSWDDFRNLNAERSKAKTAKDLTKAIGGMMILLNPIAGLLVLALGSIVANIRISKIDAEKKALLSKIDGLKTDINALQQQKTELKIEKQERLNNYLQAKDARKEFRQGMEIIKVESDAIKKELELRRQYPFTEPGHIRYIIHSNTDASIFHSGKESMVFRRKNIKGGAFDDDRIEAARLLLKDRGYMVAGDRGPNGFDGFYERLLAEQQYKDFRVGSMFIQPDGKVIFGEEKIFGNAEKTEPAFKREPEPVRPALVQEKEKEQQPAPKAKPGYEIVAKFSDGINEFRIKKEADGTCKLQHLDWDKTSIVDGKYTKKLWYNKAKFTSFSEIDRDNNYLYLKIQDVSGKTRYINQYGVDLSNKQLHKIGLGRGM